MPQVSMNSIGEYIREQREQAKISLRQLSQAAGVSNPYLSQIERGLRKPSAEILQQIAKGLRISAEALYVQAGILEDQPGDSGVRSALLADPALSERQKQVLIEIYESFRKENSATADVDQVASVAVLPRAVPAEPELEPVLPPAGFPDAESSYTERHHTERPARAARASRRDGTWAAVTDDTTEDTSGGGSEPPSGHNG
ncbi:MAG TPA: helix-turn-helix transcriptional regulator [Streptosporangiaceae bacterium]|jgi:transcriptional regulator with XRE-family HTH domain